MFWFFLLVVLIAGSPNYSTGSVGDRSYDFRSCVNDCDAVLCYSASVSGEATGWLLGVMGWTCLENCQYECMHEVTAHDLQHNRTIRQFFGKVS